MALDNTWTSFRPISCLLVLGYDYRSLLNTCWHSIALLDWRIDLCPCKFGCQVEHSSNATTLYCGRVSKKTGVHCHRRNTDIQCGICLCVRFPMHTQFVLLDKIPGRFEWSMHESTQDCCTRLCLPRCHYCLRLDNGHSSLVHSPKIASRSSDQEDGRCRPSCWVYVSGSNLSTHSLTALQCINRDSDSDPVRRRPGQYKRLSSRQCRPCQLGMCWDGTEHNCV